MGCVISLIITAIAELGAIIEQSITVFSYVALVAIAKRDDGYAPAAMDKVALHTMEPILLSDANFLNASNYSLVAWDKMQGEVRDARSRTEYREPSPDILQLHFNFDPMVPGNPSMMHQFYPRCVGFHGDKVVDDDGHLFPRDYWTPNGTADLFLPSGLWARAYWVKEIDEDQVWDCSDKHALSSAGPKPPLHEEHVPVHNKRHEMVRSYFATLPVHEDLVSKYTAEGACVLMRHLQADDMTGIAQARLLHAAMSQILSSRLHKPKRTLLSLVRRGSANVVSADVVLDSLFDAVVDAANAKDKKWMQMLAMGAIIRAVRESAEGGHSGEAEAQVMDRVFARF